MLNMSSRFARDVLETGGTILSGMNSLVHGAAISRAFEPGRVRHRKLSGIVDQGDRGSRLGAIGGRSLGAVAFRDTIERGCIVKLSHMLKGVAHWSRMPAAEVPGASGMAKGANAASRAGAAACGGVQFRLSWRSLVPKGHVIYVLSGALIIEHEDNTPNCSLDAGTSWYVGDDERHAPSGAVARRRNNLRSD